SGHATTIHLPTPSPPRSPPPRVRVVSQPHQKGCAWVAATTKGGWWWRGRWLRRWRRRGDGDGKGGVDGDGFEGGGGAWWRVA
nr:hypothetical protein [Tanacetum cinerariifolium]